MWRAMGGKGRQARRAGRLAAAAGLPRSVPEAVVLRYADQAGGLLRADAPMLAWCGGLARVGATPTGLLLLAVLLLMIPNLGARRGLDIPSLIPAALAGVVAAAATLAWRHHRRVVDRVGRLHAARAARPERCVGCGYDVGHTDAERCSECGLPVRFRLDPGPVPEPREARRLVGEHLRRRAEAEPSVQAAVGRAGLLGFLAVGTVSAVATAAWLIWQGRPADEVAAMAFGIGHFGGFAGAVASGAWAAWSGVRRRVGDLQDAALPVCWSCGSDRPADGLCPHCDAAAIN